MILPQRLNHNRQWHEGIPQTRIRAIVTPITITVIITITTSAIIAIPKISHTLEQLIIFMFAEPNQISTISLNFGRQPAGRKEVITFKSFLGQQETLKTRNQLQTLAHRTFSSGVTLIYTTQFHGDSTHFEKSLRDLHVESDQSVLTHRQGNDVFAEIVLKDQISTLEIDLPKGSNQESLKGTLAIDKDTDLDQPIDLLRNTQLSLKFVNSALVSEILTKLVQQCLPSEANWLSVLSNLKHFNLELNCGSSTKIPAQLLEALTKQLDVGPIQEVPGLSQKGKMYLLMGKSGFVECDLDNRLVKRIIEVIVVIMNKCNT